MHDILLKLFNTALNLADRICAYACPTKLQTIEICHIIKGFLGKAVREMCSPKSMLGLTRTECRGLTVLSGQFSGHLQGTSSSNRN